MKFKLLSLLAFSLLTLQSCQRDNQQRTDDTEVNTEKDTPTKMIEYLVGEWQIDNAGDTATMGQAQQRRSGGQGQQEQQTQRMIFTHEARYIHYSGNQKIDSGAYRMNEQLNNLYLESEINEEPREYEIKFEENRMTLTPDQTGQQGNPQTNQAMTFRRIGSSPNPQK